MEPEIIKGIAEEVKPLYHYLHAHPEISGGEKETSHFLREQVEAPATRLRFTIISAFTPI